ncbi:hypothetical protein NLI96_g3111 [Meripilus lineatus]|uniref:Uncharacterized protein n=1 Tax=Meripilus lineatus TaxID=2056292 RepID=A0AAD5YGW7_9APHY|nr:hypothetical protein NLI96_g3111 [Physisporinus lineatus]
MSPVSLHLWAIGLGIVPFDIKRFMTSLYLAHYAVNSLFKSLKSAAFRRPPTLDFIQVETEDIRHTPSTKSDVSLVVSEFLSADEQEDRWFRPRVTYEDLVEKQQNRAARPVRTHCDSTLVIYHLMNQSPQNPLPKFIGTSKYTGTCLLCQILIRSIQGGVARSILFRADRKICADWRLPKILPPGVQPEDVGRTLIEAIRRELGRWFSLKTAKGIGEEVSNVLILFLTHYPF